MIIIQNIDSKKFLLNGIPYYKNFMPQAISGKLRIINIYDTKFELVPFTNFNEFSIDGIVYGTTSEVQDALLPIVYTRNSLGGVVAGVEDRIVNGVTDIAPSQNIVFDEFKKIEDRLDNKDYLESDTGFYLFGQDLTMFADWKWVINGIDYANPANVVINIPLASSGYSRIDLIVCNALNGFTRVPGTESLFTPAAPLLPANTIEATFFTVTDGVVGVPVIPKPKGYVTSVNGRKGDVTLTKADVNLCELNDVMANGNFTEENLQFNAGAGMQYFDGTYTSHINTEALTDDRGIDFPNKSGVVALTSDLDSKVDKDGTKVLSDNNYTTSEKNKLASIDATHYLPPLQTTVQLSALPQATVSDKARVYVENDLADYFYDATAASGDIAPDDQAGGIGFWRKVAVGGETAASIMTKYESNADRNAFTNAEQTLVATISGKEASSNKTDVVTGNETSSTLFASIKGMVDWLTATKIRSILGISTLSGSNTGNETASTIATINHGTSAKTVLVDADEVYGGNSTSSFSLIRTVWSDVWVYIKSKADTFYQSNLVSGTNIKTVNRTSLLGSGDLTINSNVKTLSTTISESYGDSITAGYGATAGFDYMSLLSSYFGFANTNRAVSARGIWEALRLHNININLLHNKAVTVMVGFNDVRKGGNSAKTIYKIKNGYRGIIVNQFLKTFIPAKSTGGTITTSGTWNNYTSSDIGGKCNGTNGYGGWIASIGAYKEYSFTGDNVVLAMAGSDGIFEVYGNFNVYIDGVLIGNYTGNEKTDGISDGSNSNARSPYILYFGNLTDSVHTIRVTTTTNDTVAIDYFGNLKSPRNCAPLFMVEAPKMDATGYATAPNLANDTIINQLNAELNNVVNEFSTDYPIYIATTNDYYSISTGLSADHIHPNDTGYRQIYSAILNATKSLFIYRPTEISVIKIGANTILDNSYCGKVILLTASCTITLPNDLMKGFNYTIKTRAGVTLTYSFGSSVTILDNLETTMNEKSSHTMANTETVNEYLSVGSL